MEGIEKVYRVFAVAIVSLLVALSVFLGIRDYRIDAATVDIEEEK